VTADVIEGLDAKVAAAVASEVPPGLAESLRALEARVAAAEAEAAAAKAECARLAREKNDESSAARAAEVSAPGKGGSSGTSERDAPLEELAALKVRLEEVAEVAFSSATTAARLDARAEKATSPSAEGVSAADFSALRGEVRRLSEVSEGSANAEHIAFAAVESSKRATEKLDELSGTVAELAAALESARGELRELRKASLEKSPSRKAQEKETRDAEAFRARLAELDASSRATAETLKTVARNTDDRLATMKLAVETELVAVMKDFEARLEAAEGETRKANDAGEQKRWSLLEARLAETTTLAESALRRADALSEVSKNAERVAEASEAETRKLSDVVRAMARSTKETKAFAEDSVSRAAERAREAALKETRQTERAVWDTVMLLSADVRETRASRRAGSPGALRGSSQTSQTPSPRSTPRIRGEPVAGTPAGWSSDARSSSGRPSMRFAGLRRLFRSPRNDVSDPAERTDEP
jgi:glycine cleavage system H lipoate-binding protein